MSKFKKTKSLNSILVKNFIKNPQNLNFVEIWPKRFKKICLDLSKDTRYFCFIFVLTFTFLLSTTEPYDQQAHGDRQKFLSAAASFGSKNSNFCMMSANIINFGQFLFSVNDHFLIFFSLKTLRKGLETRRKVHRDQIWCLDQVSRPKVFHYGRQNEGHGYRWVHQIASKQPWASHWKKERR